MGSDRSSTSDDLDERSPIDRAVQDFQAGIDRERNFRFLVQNFYRPVQGFFARRVFSADDCLDLTQETFIGLYKGLEGFRAEARFEYWLFRIARTTYLKWLRQRERRQELNLQGLTPTGEGPSTGTEDQQPIAVVEDTQLTEVLRDEQLQELRRAIGELPTKMRQCVMLRVYQDRSYREIAESMELSIETVKAHLFQARKKLREALRDTFEGFEF